MAAKTDRVEARLSSEEHRRIRRAAQLAGQSVSSFIVAASVEKADEMIAEQSVTTVPADYFDRLLAAIDRPSVAPKLRRAVMRARDRARIR